MRFAEDEDTKDQCTSIHIEQYRDISIFSGYCAIKHIMDAIYYCAENTNDSLMNPVQRKYRYSTKNGYGSRSFSNSKECSDMSQDDCDSTSFQVEYRKNVTEKLSSAKDFISKLQPLTYRVEVIENVFSLLFVTHENIQETLYDIESESEEQEVDERSRTETFAWNDSLRISVISEESTSPTTTSPYKTDLGVSCETPATLAYDEPFQDPIVQTKPKRPSVSLTEITHSQRETPLSRLSRIKMEDLQRRGSGNCSTVSGDSTSNYLRFGLLCNEYIIRDILAMIKDCMVDLSAARFQVKGQISDKSTSRPTSKDASSLIDVRLEEQLTKLVPSSVTNDGLTKRVTQLSQYVNEAFWRFQLVCHEKIPRTPGQVLSQPVIVYIEEEEEGMTLTLALTEESATGRKRQMSTGGFSSGIVHCFLTRVTRFIWPHQPSMA